jgi:hypothetical protein
MPLLKTAIIRLFIKEKHRKTSEKRRFPQPKFSCTKLYDIVRNCTKLCETVRGVWLPKQFPNRCFAGS